MGDFNTPFHNLIFEKKTAVMIGSKEDIFMPGDFYEKTYTKLIEKIGHGEKYIFSSGEHPEKLCTSGIVLEMARSCSIVEAKLSSAISPSKQDK